MIEISIEYFAQLRDVRGKASESMSTEARTAAELYDDLVRTHEFGLPRESLRVAVNREFCPWDAPLADGDVVVFIPPVSGG